jgi:hypothetical protein
LSSGAPIDCLFESVKLNHWGSVSIFNINIDCWFCGVRCFDQMVWFLNIMCFSKIIWTLGVLNNLNFGSDEVIVFAAVPIAFLTFFEVVYMGRTGRNIWILSCVLVMVWYYRWSFSLGNWLLNSSHSFTDLKLINITDLNFLD